MFITLFDNLEKSIYNNKKIIDFINSVNQLFFFRKEWNYKSIINMMKHILGMNGSHKANHNQIFNNVKGDIDKSKDFVDQFNNMQEIFDFTEDWKVTKKEK
jgi:hypothetical protein